MNKFVNRKLHAIRRGADALLTVVVEVHRPGRRARAHLETRRVELAIAVSVHHGHDCFCRHAFGCTTAKKRLNRFGNVEGAFGNFAVDLDGLKNPNYCPEIKNWASSRGNYGEAGKYNPKPGDAILFGPETRGLPPDFIAGLPPAQVP